MKKIVGKVIAIDTDTLFGADDIVLKLLPPDNVNVPREPTLYDFVRDLPFNPEDIDYLPEKISKEKLESEIQLEFTILKETRDVWKSEKLQGKTDDELMRIAKERVMNTKYYKLITKKDAKKLLEEKKREFEKVYQKYLDETEEVLLVPPKNIASVKPKVIRIKREAS